MKELYYLKDVVTLKLDIDKCTGCGLCKVVCPHEVFELKEKKAFIKDKDLCMECGACSLNCPSDAIEVDSGVGCATAFINGKLRGTEPNCCCCGEPDEPEEEPEKPSCC